MRFIENANDLVYLRGRVDEDEQLLVPLMYKFSKHKGFYPSLFLHLQLPSPYSTTVRSLLHSIFVLDIGILLKTGNICYHSGLKICCLTDMFGVPSEGASQLCQKSRIRRVVIIYFREGIGIRDARKQVGISQ
ncbi:hypothetical protein Droror1_Dr00019573 [Drosera rotundifolia]